MNLNECCNRFPAPTTRFIEVSVSLERMSTLFKCRTCGNLIELPEMQRSVRVLSIEEADLYYSTGIGENLNKVIFENFGITVVIRNGTYFIRYDSGEVVVQMVEVEVTEQQANKVQQGEQQAYEVLLEIQQKQRN